MGAAKDAYMQDVEAANDAASVVSENVAAASASFGLPPFEAAIVIPEELPEMPAEIVEGVLLETHKMLLTGPSKANKTWGLINLAVSVATGGWWIDFKCARRKVLYIDLETDRRTLQRRISTVSAAKGADAGAVRENLAVWPLRGKSCGLAEIAAELFARCRVGDFGMVVIDPAYMVQDGDENNARDIREFFAKLDEICVNLGCTVVISHHHSKGAQGLKSAIDRGSGSGVFGRAPDAVLDMTELVLEPGTLEAARQSVRLAAATHLTGWRMSFTLREFAPRPPLDVWFCFPLHEVDRTELLADCKPNYGGVSEARKLRCEAENLGKVASLDAVCEKLIGAGTSCLRDEVRRALNWSLPTVRRWLDESGRFEQELDPKTGRALIVRTDVNDAATTGFLGDTANSGEGVQGVLPMA
ncbi:AAA family ATPase [Adlercreutzia sp. ZJ138]|uniref:AAA family ATPase n=1 Tax=Adlercreutzia sp. ZJ138 TaxID=2709405 RepID=UPI0013ED31B0|nr:AAA family ATPase [Adlercreutzia sp. ZJ138]